MIVSACMGSTQRIGACAKCCTHLLRAALGDRAFPHMDIAEIEKLPNLLFGFKSSFQVFIPLHGKELFFFIITFLAGRNNVTLRALATA